jgi:hypothetical protein
MRSRLTGIAVLALSVGVFLAPVADAGTFKGTFHSRETYVSIGGSLSFDGSTTSTAVLGRGSGASIFPTKPILGGAYNDTGVGEVHVGTTSCTFTGVFGEAETGVKTSLIGSVTASDGPLGSTFYFGTSLSGCVSLTTGAFISTETDTLFAGTGVYKGGTGTATYTSVGFTLGPPVAAGAFGFFQWARSTGKITITLP